VKQYGLRNNHGIAHAPTVSTSLFLGNNDSFEPFSQHIGTIDTLNGRHISVTKQLAEHLHKKGLWTHEIRQAIIDNRGMVGGIPALKNIAPLFKTVWEIKQRYLMQRCANRSAFIDQSASFNVYLENPSTNMLINVMLDSHKLGMKTGSYYTRTRSASSTMKITTTADIIQGAVCTREEGCLACAM
jgi:ribonucleotide reductase alpha subunit